MDVFIVVANDTNEFVGAYEERAEVPSEYRNHAHFTIVVERLSAAQQPFRPRPAEFEPQNVELEDSASMTAASAPASALVQSVAVQPGPSVASDSLW